MHVWVDIHMRAGSNPSTTCGLAADAAPYMRRNKMKIGDVIAITRRPDMQLVRFLRAYSMLPSDRLLLQKRPVFIHEHCLYASHQDI